MQINQFYQKNNQYLQVSREQASTFAKSIAGDFNPIHDPESKRFCVPGDLLFTLALHHFGFSQTMQFTFSGMVNDETLIEFVEHENGISVNDDQGKAYLDIERSGDICSDAETVSQLAEAYVKFSGLTFPHLLVPLLQKQDVMINPARPMVIYASMALDLDTVDFSNPTLEVSDTKLDIKGKRGNVELEFIIKGDGEVVGRGRKTLIVSGLQAFDEERAQGLIADYEASKSSYSAG